MEKGEFFKFLKFFKILRNIVTVRQRPRSELEIIFNIIY